MLFDWLVIGQVGMANPAHSVRGPRHSVTKGLTPVLSSEEATALLTLMDVFIGRRPARPGPLAVMTYTLARVGAVVAVAVEDYFPQKKCWCSADDGQPTCNLTNGGRIEVARRISAACEIRK